MKPRILDCLPSYGQKPSRIYEDDALVVINKPAGWLTHSDGTDSRPCLTDWHEGKLSVHSRLDVDTSGVTVFGKNEEGHRRLGDAFRRRRVEKTYLAVAERTPSPKQGSWHDRMPDGKKATLNYKTIATSDRGSVIEVSLVTGRRHQIRFQFAKHGCPLVGDARYGDAIDRRAPRTLLHAYRLRLPSGQTFEAAIPPELKHYFGNNISAARVWLDAADHTNAYRLINGAGDGYPGWIVDRYGDIGWVRQDADKPAGPLPPLEGYYGLLAPKDRSMHHNPGAIHLQGAEIEPPLWIRENHVSYAVRFQNERSTGIFLDQRPQRAWLAQHAKDMEILNTFAHAGAFSVAAAMQGAKTLNLDLSKRWLARLPEQLEHNGVDPKDHPFIAGDVFEWLPRLARQGRQFDLVILDPPSTSVGKKRKRWSAATQYAELATLAAPLVKPGGLLWASTNHRQTTPHVFANRVATGLSKEFELERICPPAVDHPSLGAAHLKVHVWRKAT